MKILCRGCIRPQRVKSILDKELQKIDLRNVSKVIIETHNRERFDIYNAEDHFAKKLKARIIKKENKRIEKPDK